MNNEQKHRRLQLEREIIEAVKRRAISNEIKAKARELEHLIAGH